MRPTRPSHAQPSTQATRETPASAAQSIPATHFKTHFVVGGGDCLFQALCMGSTNQPAVPVSMEHIMSLRQDAANYVAEHRAALIDHPSFGGEAGVNALYGLLITQGQWNEDAGDLVPPVLARVLGREIRILQPTQYGDSYDANENRIFRPQDADTGLPPAKPDTGQSPMYLAHISRAHYEYLEPRDPQADASSNSINAKLLPDSATFPADASSSRGSSVKGWLDLLLGEKKNNPTDDVNYSHRSQGSSFGRVSSLSSLESYSSKGFLEDFANEEKNSLTKDKGESHRKRSRNTEQENKVGERQTVTQVAKNQTMKAQTDKRNKRVRTHKARNEVTEAFSKSNHRSFDALTKEEKDKEVTRISQETGYLPSGVRTTLNGGGNKQIQTLSAIIRVKNVFAEANNRSFDELTHEEQTAEVTRISRQTGYNTSAVRTTLNGGGNRQIKSNTDRAKVREEFTNTVNNRPFKALTQEEQDAEVTRISRKTGYTPPGVRTTLTGEVNRQVRSKIARTQIMAAFTETAHNRPFETLTHEEQTVVVTRISQKTGYNRSGVLTILTGGGSNGVRTKAARNEIMLAFAEAANNRPFDALTHKEQSAEVTRISRETGYNTSAVRTTLTGGGNRLVVAQTARNEITKAINRSFDALTKEEKAAEIIRISRETGYNPSGVRTTLTGGGTKQVQTHVARVRITTLFTKANDRLFDALTKEEKAAEVMRISRETGYNPSGVRTTLTEKA